MQCAVNLSEKGEESAGDVEGFGSPGELVTNHVEPSMWGSDSRVGTL